MRIRSRDYRRTTPDPESEAEPLPPLTDAEMVRALRHENANLRDDIQQMQQSADFARTRIATLEKLLEQGATERERGLVDNLQALEREHNQAMGQLGGHKSAHTQMRKKRDEERAKWEEIYGALVELGKAPSPECQHGKSPARCWSCLMATMRRRARDGGEGSDG